MMVARSVNFVAFTEDQQDRYRIANAQSVFGLK